MDLNGDMELDNYEVVIGNVYEGAKLSHNHAEVTREMAEVAIKNRLAANRGLTRSVNLAVYDAVKSNLMEYDNRKELGR